MIWFHELSGACVWQVDSFSSAVIQLPLLCTLGFDMFGYKQTLSSSHKHSGKRRPREELAVVKDLFLSKLEWFSKSLSECRC